MQSNIELFLNFSLIIMFSCFASVAKLVDALDLGSSGNPVRVRVSPLAPSFLVNDAALILRIDKPSAGLRNITPFLFF